MQDPLKSIMALAEDVLGNLRFFTRLPVPAFGFERNAHAMLDFRHAARALPAAGALIGVLGALTLSLAARLGLPATLCSVLAFGVLALVTGGLHEDGLADVADGFGGGRDIARKLEIMKDSRLGSYGALALVLASLARVAALGALMEKFGPGVAAGALIAAAAVSRGACIVPLWLLPPARKNGASASAGRPDTAAMRFAFFIGAIVIIFTTGTSAIGAGSSLLAGLVAIAIAFIMTHMSKRHIGGQTGDVAGATQVLTEIGFLITLLAGH